jgi:tRNA(Ile)-lysidine synthase
MHTKACFHRKQAFFVKDMNDCFEDNLRVWMKAESLLKGGRRLLMAVSGGADSTAMVYALYSLCRDGGLTCQLAVGHVNHGLRGEQSDADEAFVKELAGRLELPVETAKVDVMGYASRKKLSIETAARMLRMEALVQQCKILDCDVIATAHHGDDQAETMVHRLMRGTGFRGLCGIRPASRMHGILFVRPMLTAGRQEIEAYCKRKGISWRQDATNDSLEPMRNRIRHVLLPELRKDWPKVTERLGELSQVCLKLQERVESEAQIVFAQALATRQADGLSLHRQALTGCVPWVFYELMRQILVQLGAGLRDYTQEHFNSMRELVIKGAGRRQYPDGIRIRAKNKVITFAREKY